MRIDTAGPYGLVIPGNASAGSLASRRHLEQLSHWMETQKVRVAGHDGSELRSGRDGRFRSSRTGRFDFIQEPRAQTVLGSFVKNNCFPKFCFFRSLVALMEVDATPGVAFEAGVNQFITCPIFLLVGEIPSAIVNCGEEAARRFLLALIHLKVLAAYPHGFWGLDWESGFLLGEPSLVERFLHLFRAIVRDLGDSIQARLSSKVDPTAAVEAEWNPAFLATEPTK